MKPVLLILFTLVCIGGGRCFSQTQNIEQVPDSTMNNIHTRKTVPVYLEKNDPMFISIKGRVVTDLKKNADPESDENKAIRAGLTGEKQHRFEAFIAENKQELEALFVKSITEYAKQVHFDAWTLITVFTALAAKDAQEIADEYDIRILSLGSDKYVAEFWEDGLAVNSEAHALKSSHEIAARNPDTNSSKIVQDVKKTYANTRKSIENGERERYSKVMALLYTKEKDGSVLYHNPYQVMTDFNKKLRHKIEE